MVYDQIPANASLKATRFEAKVPQQQVDEFKQLLKLSKLGPRTHENSGGRNVFGEQQYFGVSYDWLANAKKHWETTYDWRKSEAHINSFPNFTVDIEDEGAKIKTHFVALFSEKKDAIPITLLHGWPGSFLEFLPMLKILKSKYSPADLPYHIIVPSLPGYGYSDGAPTDKDWKSTDLARLIHKLMVGLGFTGGYIAQGGDVGSFVARILVVDYPECRAAHLNFCIMTKPESVSEDSATPAEKKALGRLQEFQNTGNAYSREHGTRPSTIGHVLSSNPLALLAWIGEKFLVWTEQDPPLDDILDSVTLYWMTETFPRAIYPYRGFRVVGHDSERWHIAAKDKSGVSKCFGFSWFPFELGPVPKSWAETTGNLVWYRQHANGGHFAAMEKPRELLEDVEDFAAKVWGREGSAKL